MPVDPQERSTCNSSCVQSAIIHISGQAAHIADLTPGVRSAMCAASPLMWMMPLHLDVNQNSDYDDNDEANSMKL